MRVLTGALICGFALTLPGAALAAEPAKALRSMTFDVQYSVRSTGEKKISGLDGGPGGGGAPDAVYKSNAPVAISQGFDIDDSGTMKIAVVAATADGGLVADVSYDGKVTRQPVERVAILKDGRLGFDPKRPPCAQVTFLLPMLARGLLGDHELRESATWTQAFGEPAVGTTRYLVKTVDNPTATLAVTTDVNVKGPQGYDEHEDGTLVYAADRQVPLRWDLAARLHRFAIDGGQTTDTHLSAKLVADSMTPATR